MHGTYGRYQKDDGTLVRRMLLMVGSFLMVSAAAFSWMSDTNWALKPPARISTLIVQEPSGIGALWRSCTHNRSHRRASACKVQLQGCIGGA